MEHEYRSVTGPELREAREALGASLKRVAAEMGVDRTTVWRMERVDAVNPVLKASRYLAALERIARGVQE